MSRWIVCVKGTPNNPGYEISVVKEDNEQGRCAYGFIGNDKVLIAGGNVVEAGIDQETWDKMLELAHVVSDNFNEEEAE